MVYIKRHELHPYWMACKQDFLKIIPKLEKNLILRTLIFVTFLTLRIFLTSSVIKTFSPNLFY